MAYFERTFLTLVIGTVGKIFPQTEIKLLDPISGEVSFPSKNGFGRKGELHVKGPQVMKGYFKEPEKTQKVLKNGWFDTGDLAVYTSNYYLQIVGRTKETIFLLNGENVEPAPIENKILELASIDSCMIVGQDKKFLGALIVPSANIIEMLTEGNSTLREVTRKSKSEVSNLINKTNGFKSLLKKL